MKNIKHQIIYVVPGIYSALSVIFPPIYIQRSTTSVYLFFITLLNALLYYSICAATIGHSTGSG